MSKLDSISGIVLFSLALLLAFRACTLTIWGPMGPREGFFPLALSILLGCFGLIIHLSAWMKESLTTAPKILGPKKVKLIFYVVSFFLFGLVLELFGYTLTMILYLIFIFRMVEKQSWRLTLLLTFFSTIISYFLFVKFLGVILPEGVLTPVVDYLRQITIESRS